MAIVVVIRRKNTILSSQSFGSNFEAAEDYAKRLRKTIPSDQRVSIIERGAEAILKKKAAERTQDIKLRKQRKRAQRRWALKAAKQKLFGQELSSSFVSELQYIEEESKVWVLLSGKKYTFFNILPTLFMAWKEGSAACTTDDTGKIKRWWIGKHPTLGGFFNTYIKPKKTYVRGWL